MALLSILVENKNKPIMQRERERGKFAENVNLTFEQKHLIIGMFSLQLQLLLLLLMRKPCWQRMFALSKRARRKRTQSRRKKRSKGNANK